MKNSFKRVLAAVLSAAMVFTAAPAVGLNTASVVQAAKAAKISGATAVYQKGTAAIKIANVTKKQYVVLTVTGAAKKKVQIKNGSKVVLKYGKTKTAKIAGTGKTLTFKVTNKAAAGKKYKVVATVYNKANNKKVKKLGKTVTVYAKTTAVTLDQTEATVEAGKTITLKATTTPATGVKAVKWSTSDAAIATVDSNGVVTGVAEGEATITVNADGKTASAKVTVTPATASKDVKISGAKVTAADTIEVTFADKMDDTKLGIDLTLGNVSISKTITWDEAKKVATLKTTANMAKGTYTITASYAEYETKDSTTVEVEAQKATKIVIKNKTALTANSQPLTGGSAADAIAAYAYYDVLDQYDQSMRTSVSIDWTGSAKVVKADKASGRITLKRTDGKAFTYGEKIYLTGVNAKTGLVANEELTIGAAQSLDSIKMLGFIKKGSTKVLDTVPKTFKAGEYLLVFSVLDQNECEMDPTEMNGDLHNQVTFTSSDVLVVAKVEVSKTANEQSVTLDGVSYGVAALEPGINVSKGGSVKINAIANKTGKQTELTVNVELEALLTSFAMSTPAGIVADGETVEIPFVAKDAEGKEITSFKVLAQNETFNTLSFAVSGDGNLVLSEQKDGSAKLEYRDAPMSWTTAEATNGIDRTVNITSIVVGGDTSNELLAISDKAYPAAIKEVNLDHAYVEGGQVKVTLPDSFKFIDQYGRVMGGDNKKTTGNSKSYFGYDNEFWSVANGRGFAAGSDFQNFTYGIKMTYLGGDNYFDNKNLAGVLSSPIGVKNERVLYTGAAPGFDATHEKGATTSVYATNKINKNAINGEGFKFEVVKAKDANGYDSTGKAYNHDITLVDIAQVKGFTISDIGRVYTGDATSTAGAVTGDGVMKNPGGLTASNLSTTAISGFAAHDAAYTKKVTVKGTYNGLSVTVPSEYIAVVGDKLTTSDGAYGNVTLDTPGAKLTVADLYDRTSANFKAIDGNGTIKATIAQVYGNEDLTQGDVIVTSSTGLGALIDSAERALVTVDAATHNFKFSDQAPVATSFDGIKDEYTVSSTGTAIASGATILGTRGVDWKVLDQYGVELNDTKAPVLFKATNSKEASGYVDNNFKAEKNDSAAMNIIGAELGDTFDLVVSVGTSLSKTTKVTVGADTLASIDKNGNNYLDKLVKNYLEPQRKAILNI